MGSLTLPNKVQIKKKTFVLIWSVCLSYQSLVFSLMELP